MPIIRAEILAGRPAAKKAELIAELTATACRVLDTTPERVRVLIYEIPAAHWGIGGVSADKANR